MDVISGDCLRLIQSYVPWFEYQHWHMSVDRFWNLQSLRSHLPKFTKVEKFRCVNPDCQLVLVEDHSRKRCKQCTEYICESCLHMCVCHSCVQPVCQNCMFLCAHCERRICENCIWKTIDPCCNGVTDIRYLCDAPQCVESRNEDCCSCGNYLCAACNSDNIESIDDKKCCQICIDYVLQKCEFCEKVGTEDEVMGCVNCYTPVCEKCEGGSCYRCHGFKCDDFQKTNVPFATKKRESLIRIESNSCKCMFDFVWM